MKRRGALRTVGTAALAAALCLSLSGCFVFSKMKWDPAVVKAGEKTRAVVSVLPETSDTGVIDKMVPFVLVGVDDGGLFELSGVRKFDVKRDFGGPYPMFADGAMEAEATSTEDCGIGSGTLNEIAGIEWTLLRTDDEVSDRDKNKAAVAKIGIESTPPQGQDRRPSTCSRATGPTRAPILGRSTTKRSSARAVRSATSALRAERALLQ